MRRAGNDPAHHTLSALFPAEEAKALAATIDPASHCASGTRTAERSFERSAGVREAH
jgi:hypothetical protein